MSVTNTDNVIETKASDYNDDEELIDIDVLTPEHMKTMTEGGTYEEETNYAGFSKELGEQPKRKEPQEPKEQSEQHDRSDNFSTIEEAEASKSNDEASKSNGNNVLYVKNIPISAREEDLENIFNDYGKVNRIDIIYDPHTNESRGFAFIEFATSKDATHTLTNAVNIQMRGKTLRVERARRGCPRSPTPGKYSGTKKESDKRRERDSPYPPYHRPPMMSGMFPYPPYGYPPQFAPPPPMHYSDYDRRDDYRKDDRDRYPQISPPRELYKRDSSRSPRRNDDTFNQTRDQRDSSTSPRRDSYQPYPYPYHYMPYGYYPYGMDSRMNDRPRSHRQDDHPRSHRQDDYRRPRSPPQSNINSERPSAPSYNAAPPPY
jgi:transformer-2 protein